MPHSPSLPLLGLLIVLFSHAAQALVWDWDGLTLKGAYGVEVNGVLYDVKFVDSTFEDAYQVEYINDLCPDSNGYCITTKPFVFDSQEDALAASQALLDQVFLDRYRGAPADFDTTNSPEFGKTLGCLGDCRVYTVWRVRDADAISVAQANNLRSDAGDRTNPATLNRLHDTSTALADVYAVWTLAGEIPDIDYPDLTPSPAGALIISPPSGIYTSNQTFDVNFIIPVPTLNVIRGEILLDGVDVTAVLANCVRAELIVPNGQALRCPSVRAWDIGLGKHTLTARIVLEGEVVASDEVNWEIIQSY